MQNIVRIWIGNPYENGNFNGTAFLINENTLITAKHVITNRDNKVYENIFISNTPDGGITPIDSVKLCNRDIAILSVKKSFIIEKVLFSKEIKEGKEVNIIGFYDKDSSVKTYQNRVSGYQNSKHTYELQNHLTNGLSGSPIFLDDKICGVATAINSKKNLTYVVPISELCMELNYQAKKEILDEVPQKKKLTLERVGIIAGIIGVFISILTNFLPNSNTIKENAPTNTGSGPQINIGSTNQTPTIININSNTDAYCQDRVFKKQKNVNRFIRELNASRIPEFRKNINFDLSEAKLQLKQVKEDCLNKK